MNICELLQQIFTFIAHPVMATDSQSLVILGCSQRKRQTSRLLPAVDRYDGPTFQVLRKHAREAPEQNPNASILSARFGLIDGNELIPRYNRELRANTVEQLRSQVCEQLNRTLDNLSPEKIFVSVGSKYWELIEGPLSKIETDKLIVAHGSIGGRASQLAHWLSSVPNPISETIRGKATLLGTTVSLSKEEIILLAREAMKRNAAAAKRFETWFVPIDDEHVAPKWLVSLLFKKPVARFRTANARRVLSHLGIDCKYAGNH